MKTKDQKVKSKNVELIKMVDLDGCWWTSTTNNKKHDPHYNNNRLVVTTLVSSSQHSSRRRNEKKEKNRIVPQEHRTAKELACILYVLLTT